MTGDPDKCDTTLTSSYTMRSWVFTGEHTDQNQHIGLMNSMKGIFGMKRIEMHEMAKSHRSMSDKLRRFSLQRGADLFGVADLTPNSG
jgi:hypothetical protein